MLRSIYHNLKRRIPSPLWPTDMEQRLRTIRRRAKAWWSLRSVSRRVQWLHGPTTVLLRSGEFVVLCVVRNGQRYIGSYRAHYRNLGARHFFFMDNRSTDNTVALLTHASDTTVLSCNAEFARYAHAMKQYLILNYGKTGWVVFADIDELFDYPHSRHLRMEDLIRYLEHNRYTAVVTHMLDMFTLGDGARGSLGAEIVDLHHVYRYYDLTDLQELADGNLTLSGVNRAGNDQIPFYTAGIRYRSFGARCWLTKHALFDARQICHLDFHEHFVRRARLADFSGVLYHYLFTDWFLEKCREVVALGAHYNNASDYKQYLSGMTATGRADGLVLEKPEELLAPEQLVEEGFLHVSRRYEQWIQQQRSV